VPVFRAFRALRYATDAASDLGRVVAPPYDVISPAEGTALLARDPRNVVRLDLPASEPADEPEARYRRAARTLAEWRSDGTLRKDPRPSVYLYEQRYRVPGTTLERTQLGWFARLRLEPFGPGGGVRPHERTLAGPKEDRYRLLRATGANTSPVVVLYDDASGRSSAILATLAAVAPDVDVVVDDVRHRLWAVEARSDDDRGALALELLELAGRAPVTIADGHHRYETALRYRDERRMTRSCEEDPAFDYLLALALDVAAGPLTVLPTHRVVRGLGDDAVERLLAGARAFFDVAAGDAAAVMATMAPGSAPADGGRFGLLTRRGSAVLTARREAFEAVTPVGDPATRTLDVSLLGIALERLCGIDPAAVATGERVAYTKSTDEAAAWVRDATNGADAAFLLDPTPVASIVVVAAAGEVMPQKSTYFYPKALTGLVINPLEW
jgi:uncharacterized protein (DUF1015 family)